MIYKGFATIATVLAIFAITYFSMAAGKQVTTAYEAMKEHQASDSSINEMIIGGFTATLTSASVPDLTTLAGTAIIMATAFVAAHRFELFREGQPHLTLQQSVHHQPLGSNYRLVAVTTTLTNSSKILVSPRAAWCRIAQTAPLSDEDVLAIYNDGFEQPAEDAYEQYGWWELSTVHKNWPPGQFTVEPNETTTVPFQFIISADVAAVAIVVAIIKPGHHLPTAEASSPPAWTYYTFLELPPINHRRDQEAL